MSLWWDTCKSTLMTIGLMQGESEQSIFKGYTLLLWKKMFISVFLYLVCVYMYVPKCTHTTTHMCSEDNFQDLVPFFHVGPGDPTQTVMSDMSPRGPSGCLFEESFVLSAILLAFTGYILKGQSENRAELSMWLWMWLWFQSGDSAADKWSHWWTPLSTRRGWGSSWLHPTPTPHARVLTLNSSV